MVRDRGIEPRSGVEPQTVGNPKGGNKRYEGTRSSTWKVYSYRDSRATDGISWYNPGQIGRLYNANSRPEHEKVYAMAIKSIRFVFIPLFRPSGQNAVAKLAFLASHDIPTSPPKQLITPSTTNQDTADHVDDSDQRS